MGREAGRDEFIRKRVARQKKLRKRRLRIFFVVFILFLILLGIILSLTVFFPIKNIKASGSKVYKAEQIIDASGIDEGDNLFVVSSSSVLEKLKTKLPFVETVELKRKLSGDIEIVVKDADEYAVIFSNNRYYTVSRKGWVLAEADKQPPNIFLIRGVDARCKVGKKIVYKNEEQKLLVNKITDALKGEKINIDYVDIADSLNLQAGVEKRFEVLIGSSNNIEEKIKHLRGMLEKISPESSGKINLSMWTVDNTTATFVEKNDKK